MGVVFVIGSSVYQAVMYIGGIWCHQIAERSPHILGIQMPLCWRCTGIVLGSLTFLAWFLVKKQLPALVTSIALAALMPIDALAAILGIYSGHNSIRFVTGILWGVFIVAVLFHAVSFLARTQGQRTPSVTVVD